MLAGSQCAGGACRARPPIRAELAPAGRALERHTLFVVSDGPRQADTLELLRAIAQFAPKLREMGARVDVTQMRVAHTRSPPVAAALARHGLAPGALPALVVPRRPGRALAGTREILQYYAAAAAAYDQEVAKEAAIRARRGEADGDGGGFDTEQDPVRQMQLAAMKDKEPDRPDDGEGGATAEITRGMQRFAARRERLQGKPGAAQAGGAGGAPAGGAAAAPPRRGRGPLEDDGDDAGATDRSSGSARTGGGGGASVTAVTQAERDLAAEIEHAAQAANDGRTEDNDEVAARMEAAMLGKGGADGA
jgi:hypothetical protein